MTENRWGGLTGGFIVCRDGRLEATGPVKECLVEKTRAGSHIAVELIKKLPLFGVESASGYWAEIVITGPVAGYKGPPSHCRLPSQFERFKKQSKPETEALS